MNRPIANGTPNGGGRFKPPAAPRSRGVTPRSASRKGAGEGVGGGLGVSNKPKFTAEQQLEIIKRLESGNYKKQVGMSQFYDEFHGQQNGSGGGRVDPSKFLCKQNLLASFGSGSMERNPLRSIWKVGSMESLNGSVVSSSTARSGTTSATGTTVLELPVPHGFGRGGGASDKLPYAKLFDKLTATWYQFAQALGQLGDAECKVQFGRLVAPDKMGKYFFYFLWDYFKNLSLNGLFFISQQIFARPSTAR